MRLPQPRRSARIAVAELQVSWRSFREASRVQHAVMGIAGVFGLLFVAVAVGGAFLAGRAVGAGEVPRPVEAAGLVPAAAFVGTLAFSTYLTAVQYGDSNILEGLLTTVPHRDVAGGLLVATFCRVWLVFVVPLLLGAVSFGIGAGNAAAVALALLTVLVVILPAYSMGFGLGLAVRHLFGQSETLVRYRAVLGVGAFLAYVALLATERVGEITQPVIAAASTSPISWVADLLLLSLAPAASPVRAAAALLGGVAGLLLGLLLTVRAAGILWYADPVEPGDGSVSSSGVGWLGVLVNRRSAWVARKSWLRARRAPLKLIYVAYPLFFLIEPVQSSLQSGTIATTLPAFTAVYGAWATGAAFGLNPLGDEGAVLPITATTGITGREMIRGLLVASLVPGLSVTVVLTGVLAVTSDLPALAAAAMTVGAAGLCVAAAGVSVGIGAAMPRFDAATVTRSRAVVVPSIWAFITYTIVVTVLATPATAAQIPAVATSVGSLTGLGGAGVQVLGLAVALVLVGLAATVGTRYGARRFDEFYLD